jgi:hypothetical protein
MDGSPIDLSSFTEKMSIVPKCLQPYNAYVFDWIVSKGEKSS